MKKWQHALLVVATSLIASTAFANASGHIYGKDYTLYAQQSTPMSYAYQYSITNKTSETASYHVHLYFAPEYFQDANLDKDISLTPGQTFGETINFGENVMYMNSANLKCKAQLKIWGQTTDIDTKFEQIISYNIYVRN